MPATADAAAVKWMLAVPDPGDAMVAGANAAVTPAGRPLIVSVTAAFNPLVNVVTLAELVPPTFTLAA